MSDDPRTKRQRKAQTAVQAIADSDDPPEIKRAELERFARWALKLASEVDDD